MRARTWLGHALGWGLLMLLIGLFANGPAYRHLGPDEATITLSLRHAGQLLGACHTLTAEELARLPATLRAPQDCPRERSPLEVELLLGERLVISKRVEPRGLHKDGMASMYQRLTVPAGTTNLRVRMKDNIRDADFKWILDKRIDLSPAQVLVIDFDAARGGFQVY